MAELIDKINAMLDDEELQRILQVVEVLKQKEITKGNKIDNQVELLSDREIAKLDNKLVEAKYNLTLEEMRLIFLTIAQLDVNDEDFKTYQISLKDLEERTGSLKKHSRLKNFMTSIMKKPIFIDKNTVVNWFSYIHYNEGRASLDVRFDKALKPYLLSLKENFTKFNIQNVLKLKSVYAVRIYQLLKQYEKIGKRRFNVEYLQTILQTPKSYSNYKDFRKKVLDISVREINEKTDLKINYVIVGKIKRKVTEIEFNIQKQSISQIQKNNQRTQNTTKKQNSNSLSKITDFKDFRKKVLTEYNDKILLFEDKIYTIITNYLAINNKILTPEEALDEWHLLYVNKDNIKILSKDEFNKQIKQQKMDIDLKIKNIQEKIFYKLNQKNKIIDEFRVVQINNIDTQKQELNLLLQSKNDLFSNFNLNAKIDEYYEFSKFYLNEDDKKFKWVK